MTVDLAEDILEEMLNLGRTWITRDDLSRLSSRGVKEFIAALSQLKKDKAITEGEKGFNLTELGKQKAETIARKHAVLASFLTDVLGAKPEDASEEACILEHTISNETINKLDSFLDKTTPEFVSHKELTAKNPIVPLLECTEGSLLHVAMIEAFSKHNRLIDLGVVPGELITLKRRLHNDAVVIKVKGCDIALSPEIASSIMVERCNTK